MYQLNISNQVISIEGEVFTSLSFQRDAIPSFANKSDFHQELFLFLRDWFSDSDFISVKTSGSTGIPKEMEVEKQKMMQSAVLTCQFLGLEKGGKALLCMPLQYIAGKMFMVRALVANLDLYPIIPSGNPLKNCNIEFDFGAMVPLQVFNSLQEEEEKERLQAIKNLIIGGGAIDAELSEQLKIFPNKVFSTYGMTETLSHIALRKLNGKDASENYIPFDSVKLSLSNDDTLIIDAPLVSDEVLNTNDIADIFADGSFKILGRKDNVINSGGIKIQIEKVEQLYTPFISIPFAVSAKGDAKFGDILVLVSEEEVDLSFLENIFPTHLRAKHFLIVDEIPLTETSKIDRAKLKLIVNQ